MKPSVFAVIFFLLLFPAAGWGEYQSPIYLEKTTIYVNEHPLVVEIANTEAARQKGLMFRRKLLDNEGMLFIFPSEDYLTFWMKNTLIPLSIGYFNKDKRMVDSYEMEPNQTKVLYHSTEKVLYALEANKGWFAKKGLGRFAVLKLDPRFIGK
ncbi:hypothetical protein LEP1GSC058_1198 [Leptospira fainei serovar Hurstbridge str. BUT 6]|uniref:DUF192 domain-containing protein n=1 Tax=Leptospira fainei serovar Hurstbridge str. BUT 6 TaxID=1193011 RepID=S3V6T0_9LEPT|nr:DUF192 domain-containing protein [Leptospira fainei]EPG76369.1 hypothetical protein LEP1GSC058_1198 [Leptospira fainei serovar Hurstbridge str. BUT 6]